MKGSWKILSLLALFSFASILPGFSEAYFVDLDWAQAIRFLGVLLGWVWLPGVLPLRMAGIRQGRRGFWTLAFAAGTVMVTAAFMACRLAQVPLAGTFLGPAVSAASLFLLCREGVRPGSLAREIRLSSFFWCTGLALAGFSLVLCFYRNPSPGAFGGVSSLNADLLWTVGNIHALLHAFPPMDWRVAGVPFNYHYFSMAYRGALCELAGIAPFAMATFFYPFSAIFFTVFSLRFLYGSFARSGRETGSRLFVLVTLFTSSAGAFWIREPGKDAFFNGLQLHILAPTHGFEMAFPFFAILLGILAGFPRWRALPGKALCALLAAFSGMATGFKGPAGALALMSAAGLVPGERLSRRSSGKAMAALCACLSGFLLVLFLFVRPPGGNGMGLALSPGFLVRKTWPWIGGAAASVALIPVHLFLFLPFGAFGTAGWLRSLPRGERGESLSRAAPVLLPLLCGIAGGYLLSHQGISNVYFLLLAVAPLNLLASAWAAANWKRMPPSIRLACCVLVLAGFLGSAAVAWPSLQRSATVASRILEGSRVVRSPREFSLSRGEYDALLWIGRNVPPASVLAGERFWISERREVPHESARFFCYSAFSGRQQYLEGWGYSALHGSPEGRAELERRLEVLRRIFGGGRDAAAVMEGEGIDCILVVKALRPDFSAPGLRCLYDNREAAVYGPEKVSSP